MYANLHSILTIGPELETTQISTNNEKERWVLVYLCHCILPHSNENEQTTIIWTTRMNLSNIMSSGRSQIRKSTYCMIPLTWSSKTRLTCSVESQDSGYPVRVGLGKSDRKEVCWLSRRVRSVYRLWLRHFLVFKKGQIGFSWSKRSFSFFRTLETPNGQATTTSTQVPALGVAHC